MQKLQAVVAGAGDGDDEVCWTPETGVGTGHAPQQDAGRHAGHMEVDQIAHCNICLRLSSVQEIAGILGHSPLC